MTDSPTYDVGLDSDGDIPEFCRHITGTDLILQRVKVRFGTFLTEWPLDSSVGLDFIGWQQEKPAPLVMIEAASRAELDTCPGVQQVLSLVATATPDGKSVTIEGSAQIDGAVIEIYVPRITPEAGNDRPEILILFASGRLVP